MKKERVARWKIEAEIQSRACSYCCSSATVQLGFQRHGGVVGPAYENSKLILALTMSTYYRRSSSNPLQP